jgi:hypothetical protein
MRFSSFLVFWIVGRERPTATATSAPSSWPQTAPSANNCGAKSCVTSDGADRDHTRIDRDRPKMDTKWTLFRARFRPLAWLADAGTGRARPTESRRGSHPRDRRDERHANTSERAPSLVYKLPDRVYLRQSSSSDRGREQREGDRPPLPGAEAKGRWRGVVCDHAVSVNPREKLTSGVYANFVRWDANGVPRVACLRWFETTTRKSSAAAPSSVNVRPVA